jgi:hypothetical protein
LDEVIVIKINSYTLMDILHPKLPYCEHAMKLFSGGNALITSLKRK